ncbi:helix-turn-helix domain-containing protein [Streptomyces yunnanensis]|uniref:Helix-turn-helix domain-containing protein n=1 Tax=Streptomyces yunnanensis TaxID=156453 RepID=A0ABY8A475_9ACTN|nr:helix-turn-helix transcriptional regulator [Streptomyces yunnanensis]WEB39758.1 helix-turn-helix domain-containing protein [Streptomyces yunnanensis]
MNKNELNPDASPQAAFGARLRSLREACGWTQEALADRTGYSSVHVSAVENARKPPTLRFSRDLDRAFGIEGADTFERQYREIKHGSLLEGFPEYVNFEGRAVEIRLYEVGVIPGLLQTPEYAATLEADAVRRAAITPEQAEERVELVSRRQATIARAPAPLIHVVLDESCVRRPMGAPTIMDAQFDRLLKFAEMPNTLLQIAPFKMGARRPFSLPVTVLTMADRAIMSYAESAQRGHLERDGGSVVPILTAYHQLQAEALSQAASVAMIEQLRKGSP